MGIIKMRLKEGLPENEATLYIPFLLKVRRESAEKGLFASPTWVFPISDLETQLMEAYVTPRSGSLYLNFPRIMRRVVDIKNGVCEKLSGKVYSRLDFKACLTKDILLELAPEVVSGRLFERIEQEEPELTVLNVSIDALTLDVLIKVQDEATEADMMLLINEISKGLNNFLLDLYDEP